jgi:phenylalanyl-tRNA synthetase beta chain
MKYALSWLTDYVGLKSDIETLADRLIMTTAEVEEIIEPPLSLTSGVVAEVTAVEPHPNADRLRLVTVRSPRGTDTVVCGAPNVAVGQRVPFLPAGSFYAGDGGSFCKLETATIRGVKSSGMLASERDLGLSGVHEGIMILPGATSITTPLAVACGFDRPVLDLEITPNRGDLLSYWGLAREVSFIDKTRLKEPALLSIAGSGDHSTEPKIKLESEDCPRYAALVIDGLTVGPAPLYMQQRLRLSGIEPINAIVDVTNYVMLELGQPLHAFDWHLLTGSAKQPTITVRQAISGEKMTCLDHVERHLTKDDLVIANAHGPVALAGLIGGTDTAVHAGTTRVVLESASFQPSAVRRMSKRHNLRTEAVTRFEKEVDSELPVRALKRAAYLLKEICGGQPSGSVVDTGQAPARHRRLSVDLERASRILGLPITKASARQLCQIGFEVSDKKSTIVEVTVPSWRNDVTIEEDVYEELVRLVGYDKLPATLPNGPITPTGQDSTFNIHRTIRTYLAAAGLREVLSQAFISDQDARRYKYGDNLVRVMNPPTRHESFARPDLLPALINRLGRESLAGSADLQSFEIGHTFTRQGKDYLEADRLAIAVLTSDPQQTTRQLKGIITGLAQAANRQLEITFDKGPRHGYLTKPESIQINNEPAGLIGLVDATLIGSLKIRGKRSVIATEIDLSAIMAAPLEMTRYAAPATYPGATRDLTVYFDASQTYHQAFTTAQKQQPELAITLTCVDCYETAERKGFTLRLVYRAADRTLTDQEIAQAQQKFTAALDAAGLHIKK